MQLGKRMLAAVLGVLIAIPAAGGVWTAVAEENKMNITIDGEKLITAKNKLYRGAGMVTGNNSSRLLLDYKAEHPDAYWAIMNHLFGKKGIGLTHIKIEMGSDINSSSGTEPNVMRTEDEAADVTRGAGYQLAADAKTINPDITLDMLYWSEPLWVTNAEDVYAARYKWYKSTLDAAYKTYGLKFDYVSATRNERASDASWIKYLANALDAETDCPYDYSGIRIVAGDEVCTWGIANAMLGDEALLDAIDVVGSHYTSWSSQEAKMLADSYGKELWFSEASSPMSYAQGSYRFDGTGSGMSDINGLLDIANRFITMFPGGYMTLCEYQPVISAYYDGVTYCQKQMITANTPWSGSYYLDGGYYMALHFSQFLEKGWAYIDGASNGDGKAGGDGHAIVDSVYTYMTAADTETNNYTTVLTNSTSAPITYHITVKNLEKAAAPVYVWETRGPDGGAWNENYFRHIDTITPAESADGYTYSVTIKPYSLVTLSTVERDQADYVYPEISSPVLELPYTDDYEYTEYAENYLASRGNAPRYTTDEGGAFEVQQINGNNVLMQMITPDIKSQEWGGTPKPTTNFGDDRWFNYSVSADVAFAASDAPAENYTGIGLRYNLADSGESGYWIQLYENGSWQLKRNKDTKLSGVVDGFDSTAVHNLRIEAVDHTVKAYIDDALIAEYNGEAAGDCMLSAGRAALYSSYNRNWFDCVAVQAVANTETYILRYDNTNFAFDYTGEWTHTTMSSFKNYKRTIAEGGENAGLSFTFSGNGFALTGLAKDAAVAVEIDGAEVETGYMISESKNREVIYYRSGLENKEHTVKLRVVSGTVSIDGAQITGAPLPEAIPVLSDAEPEEAMGGKNLKKYVLPLAIGAAGVAAAGVAAAIVSGKKRRKD